MVGHGPSHGWIQAGGRGLGPDLHHHPREVAPLPSSSSLPLFLCLLPWLLSVAAIVSGPMVLRFDTTPRIWCPPGHWGLSWWTLGICSWGPELQPRQAKADPRRLAELRPHLAN